MSLCHLKLEGVRKNEEEAYLQLTLVCNSGGGVIWSSDTHVALCPLILPCRGKYFWQLLRPRGILGVGRAERGDKTCERWTLLYACGPQTVVLKWEKSSRRKHSESLEWSWKVEKRKSFLKTSRSIK